MNRVELVGRLGADPVLRQAGSTNLVGFDLAVKKYVSNGEADSDWISCLAFGKTAEYIANYCKRGNLLSVEGRLSTKKEMGNDGINRTILTVIVERVNSYTTVANPNSNYQGNNYSNNANNNYNMNNNMNNNFNNNNYNNGYNNNNYINNNNNYSDFGNYQDAQQQNFDMNNGNQNKSNSGLGLPQFNVKDDELPF